MICHICNTKMKEAREKYHYTESGLGNVYLGGICVYKCECGEFFPSIPDIVGLHTVIGKLIVQKASALDGKEITFLRKNIGFSAKKFAGQIGIDKSTLSRWENNQQKTAKPNDRFIRLLYGTVKGLPKEDLEHLLKNAAKDFHKNKISEPINIPITDYSSGISCSA